MTVHDSRSITAASPLHNFRIPITILITAMRSIDKTIVEMQNVLFFVVQWAGRFLKTFC